MGAFRLLNTVLERLVPPPSPAQPVRWKWRNIWTSLAHSLLSGSWALLGFYFYPPMGEDLIDHFSPSAHCLLGISIGYFVQDSLDMICNEKLQKCWELLFHHFVVSYSCFSCQFSEVCGSRTEAWGLAQSMDQEVGQAVMICPGAGVAAGAPRLLLAVMIRSRRRVPISCSRIPAASARGSRAERTQGNSQLSLAVFQVIVCFGFAFLVRRFVGFAMVALLVEINSVFLHLRKILQMAGLANTASFRLTSLVNLGTYLVFRILILAWMSHWLALNWENVPAVPCAMGMMGMAIMLPINVVLFYRLLRSDLLPSHKK
ncbi:hypothetical protein Chor_009725 [Crotalus horridus]